MAFDEALAGRIRDVLARKKGVCFCVTRRLPGRSRQPRRS
jgi:hypothetical protein